MKITSKGYRRLRSARIAISMLIMVTCGIFVALGYDIWLSRWQIVPALLACSLAWVLLWLGSALLMGRIYCSTACPLGTLQDCLIAVSRRRRRGFFYRPQSVALRWSVVIVVAICLVLGFPAVASLAEPASAFNRIAIFLTLPFIKPAAASIFGAIIAAITLAAVAWIALTRGRRLCNTLCPVGTLLGTLSNYSLLHVDINTDKCTGCGRCVSRCKGECIDPSSHTIDLQRCVVCFDCVAACPNEAITLRRGRHKLKMPLMQPTVATDAPAKAIAGDAPAKATTAAKTLDRRAFLAAITGASALTATAGSLSTKKICYITPPGSQARELFKLRCTSCGLCVAACPTHVIKASFRDLGIRNALHPVLDFDQGACLYDCVRCTTVCPTGALQPLTAAEKHHWPIGKARLNAADCLEYSRGEACGICQRRCPARAITIIPEGTTTDGRPRRIPTLNTDACIGCGTCQYYCPAPTPAWLIDSE